MSEAKLIWIKKKIGKIKKINKTDWSLLISNPLSFSLFFYIKNLASLDLFFILF